MAKEARAVRERINTTQPGSLQWKVTKKKTRSATQPANAKSSETIKAKKQAKLKVGSAPENPLAPTQSTDPEEELEIILFWSAISIIGQIQMICKTSNDHAFYRTCSPDLLLILERQIHPKEH